MSMKWNGSVLPRMWRILPRCCGRTICWRNEKLRAADCHAYEESSLYKRKGCKFYAPLAKGDSPQCGEMSRSDRGDGRPLGGSGIAAGGIAPEAIGNPSVCSQARSHLPLQGRQIGFILLGSLAKGDSPQCGEMSRSDKGDGRQLGAVSAAD